MSPSTRASDAVGASDTSPLPDITGTLRDCSPTGKGRRKLRAGDIAVIDAPNISRREAEYLVDAAPAAVVNAGPFTTGSAPHFGPLMLLDAGIPLFENAGAELRAGFRDGAKKGRIEADGTVHNGSKLLASATPLKRTSAESSFAGAQTSLVTHMESYYRDSLEVIHTEAPLLIDGLGVPDIGDDLSGRKVLVVSPGAQHREQLRGLRNFIREYDPAIIGVGAAADTLVEMGYEPSVIVGDPADVDAETLRGNARVILPADADGNAVGLERIQNLGVGALTFPATIESPTDLALLLAAEHDAELIVNAGAPLNLTDVFADTDRATPGSVLTRLKLGERLVDAAAVTNLYTVNRTGGASLAWLWALLGILVALATIVLVVGLGGDSSFTQNLVDAWNSLALWFQGLFR
ncbi:putative cytokinetic ring protein SteA [Corynebacterium doosanense]|uniref:Thiamine pyrophosphokinase n=1 Tax=Corynebacterium doosanense CAU 212 = DSM 45436 TaxID=558173 RepID=A0A097IFX0_9CORY|nr:putative cytokinetic ring protein SteA [Corynebacterium doosanense]AIT61026.1 thiamine pyrophosphokinase [Corynebacterium doosanense CAU 212 = DSM 45436]